MTDEIQWSDLRLHDGGECPVGPDEVVRVVFRTWNACMRIVPASTWRWKSKSNYRDDDIIAYQVQIKPQRKMIVPWHVLPPEYDHAYKGPDRTAFAYDGHGNMIRIDQLVGYEPGDDPWGLQSLVRRPEASA